MRLWTIKYDNKILQDFMCFNHSTCKIKIQNLGLFETKDDAERVVVANRRRRRDGKNMKDVFPGDQKEHNIEVVEIEISEIIK